MYKYVYKYEYIYEYNYYSLLEIINAAIILVNNIFMLLNVHNINNILRIQLPRLI